MTIASAPAPQRRGNRLLLSQWVDLLEDDSFRRYWLMRLASHGAANALTYSLLVFTLRLSDIDINIPLERRVFDITPDLPEKPIPLTLDELRRAGPLGGS